MDSSDDRAPEPGRPIDLTPAPPGLWWVLLGAMVAVLAPLFGFLIGTILIGDSSGSAFGPVYLGLFTGVIIGALGVLAAGFGGRKLYLAHRKAHSAPQA